MTRRTRKMFALVSIISLLFGMNVSAEEPAETPDADTSTGQVKITVVPDDGVDITALHVGDLFKMKIVLENQSEMNLSPEIVVTSEIDGEKIALVQFIADETEEALYEVKTDAEVPTVLVKELKAQEKLELPMEGTIPEKAESKAIALHVKVQKEETIYGETKMLMEVKTAEPPVEEEKPEETELPVEEENPEETEPPVEEENPEETEPPVEEEKPEETEPPVEEEKPEETEPPVEEEKPEETEPPVEEEKPEEPSEEDKLKEEELKKQEEELKKKEEELKKKEEELKKKEAEEKKKAEEAKKAEEKKKAEEAKKAEEKKKAEEAKKAAEKKKAEEARKAAEAAKKKSTTPHTGDETDTAPALLGVLMAVAAAVSRRKR